jgi:SAM-dependent methyltransferase
MASIISNRQTYNDPGTWNRCGDSWTFHADSCGQDYGVWKRSVVETFLDPYLGSSVDVLEVGPGFGRWTEFIVARSHSLTLVDVSSTCIEACQDRFGDDLPERAFVVNDGRSLPLTDSSLDLIWSFATFVHIDAPDVDAYLAECYRTLRPGGHFVIHHAGWGDWSLKLSPVTSLFGRLGYFVQHRILAVGRWSRAGGRAPMSARRFARMAVDHGFDIDFQGSSWGDQRQFSVSYRDVITVGTKRSASEVSSPV